MKNILLGSILLFTGSLHSQVSGNINYQEQKAAGNVTYDWQNYQNYYQSGSTKAIDLHFGPTNDLIIEVNGLSNVSADSYVAIFHVTQMGKTAKEVNALLNSRIDSVKSAIATATPDAEVFVDMLSFVPVYEYEVDKKLFSKDTYNEIPKGFELKKNIHVKYTDPDLLSTFISICTEVEIYDLVRVDYICNDLEERKRELAKKAVEMIQEKSKRFELLLDVDFDSLHKQIIEGFQVFYPIEQYRSYTAFSSASLDLKKVGAVNAVSKPRTTFFQAKPTKEYDFVMNPVMLEPAIQIVYQIKLKVAHPPQLKSAKISEKEYLLITNSGDIKTLQIGN